MYQFNDPLIKVRGIGASLGQQFANNGLNDVKDLLGYLPIRYEDLSQLKKIAQLETNQAATLTAKVVSSSLQYKGRNSILRAKIADESGQLSCIWFNNPHLKDKLVTGKELHFSGKLNDRGFFAQPRVEECGGQTIHTGRLVPIYSTRLGILQGKLRRILKEIIDNLEESPDSKQEPISQFTGFPPITWSLQQLHFPDSVDNIERSQRRLALDELLSLITKSRKIKNSWDKLHRSKAILTQDIPNDLPFELTSAQKKAISQIEADLKQTTAMNRLLIGDVGSGKTIVAGIAANDVIKSGGNVVLIAPTQILAEQHQQSLMNIFPDLSIKLLTAQNSKKFALESKACFYIGTHALLNKLTSIEPWLVIFDEQHRFGVMQRSVEEPKPEANASQLSSTLALADNKNPSSFSPHLLTMTATPIPRSLMLTVFSHLKLSTLDELPVGRIPAKTWVVPNKKRDNAWKWLAQELINRKQQGIVVCPFIDPSFKESLENVAAASDIFEQIKSQLSLIQPKLRLALLHSKLPNKSKDKIVTDLFAQKIDLLITTPIVEVGVDLPKASFMVIESAERFGMASLHQLRGRVGRAGQESFCLLFTNSSSKETLARLKLFSEETNGQKLAEYDLKNRGAGDLFGTDQHGFDSLRFASWTDFELIKTARDLHQQIEEEKITWQPFFGTIETTEEKAVAAN
ncbi:MAG: ATP-dependent DNA helicase RecG [Patescibacteria group bacterium]